MSGLPGARPRAAAVIWWTGRRMRPATIQPATTASAMTPTRVTSEYLSRCVSVVRVERRRRPGAARGPLGLDQKGNSGASERALGAALVVSERRVA